MVHCVCRARLLISRCSITTESDDQGSNHGQQGSFSGKDAIGVEVIHSDDSVESIFGGEVILSAGTINSPSILLRSGVGPVDDLDRLKIDCVNNLQGVEVPTSLITRLPLLPRIQNLGS